ncbi:MAG: hypothetical protein IKA09_03660 [Lachnospiraceae bacterium]|nr:hypothetical protein [Lachnospiraceae bacterium]
MKKITIICILTLSLFAVVCIGVIRNDNGAKTNSEEAIVHHIQADWPFYTFNSAIEQATTIAYGKVVKKSKTKSHQTTTSSGNVHTEYYKEVSIKVIDVLKGDVNDKTITYLEFGGETKDAIYIWKGVVPVDIGDEYIFFLNPYGAFLSPMTLLAVDDGTVLTKGKIAPDAQENQGEKISDISVETYLEAIKSKLK